MVATINLAFVVILIIYSAIALNRDKKDRKEFKKIGKQLEQEEKRRAKEEKLRLMRVKHPKVVYLNDYRPIPPSKRIV